MKTIFWNVDTQYDFMRDDSSFKGAFAVPGARGIEKNLKKLTKFAEKHGYQVVNTADWHTEDSKEFSKDPDFVSTFPPHCLQDTKGSNFIPATKPKNPYIVSWNDESTFDMCGGGSYVTKEALESLSNRVMNTRNIVLYKDAFDVFEGNPHTKEVLEMINPQRVVVYGVATNYCVNYAIKGLVKAGKRVYVPLDAVKEIPGGDLEELLNIWKTQGVALTKTDEILSSLEWEK